MSTFLEGIATGLRKRVLLKSPVRENRMPGSVRGRLGDWPSHCDGGARSYQQVGGID